MSDADVPQGYKPVIHPAGSISAEQRALLGHLPGAKLQVASQLRAGVTRFGGSMPELPEVSWEDFERGSALARTELNVQ